eukprot:gene8496-10092_t
MWKARRVVLNLKQMGARVLKNPAPEAPEAGAAIQTRAKYTTHEVQKATNTGGNLTHDDESNKINKLRDLESKHQQQQQIGIDFAASQQGQGAPPSVFEDYKKLAQSGGQLRTGYTHQYADMDPSVDRSAAREFRAKCRSGEHTGQSSGFVMGFVQCNLVILPKENAFDFLSFALRNPKACPLLSVTSPGDPCPRNIAPGADIRTDIPKYRIWRDGKMSEEVTDITSLWTDDMVAFLVGCSFSWEGLLADAGLCPRHVEEGVNVPMFRTNLKNDKVGPFEGDLVVTFRPYATDKVAEVAAITSQYPGAHGGPIHWGDPSVLGLDDLTKPDWGDAVTIKEGEVPMFWACGISPQTAIMGAKLPLAITHAPGHMFIADVLDCELKVAV